MVRLNVALLQTDLSQKIEHRIDEVARAARAMHNRGNVGLVVAPQYHFRRHADVKQCHISREYKDYICDEITKISDRYPNVVIIPGTIPWRVKRDDRESLSRKIVRQGPSYFGSTNNMEVDGGDKFDLVANDAHDEFCFNTAYVFHDNRVYALDKEGDFQESTMDKILVHEKIRPVFELRVNGQRLRFGVEICLNHCMGTLNSYLGSLGRDVDVHVIVSDYVSNSKPLFRARRGGAIVHASTADRGGPEDDNRLGLYYTSMGPRVWDFKKKALSTKTNCQLLPGVRQDSNGTYYQPLGRKKRVTNVFKVDGSGNIQSLRVNRGFGAYTVCDVSLD